jgi:hypothetical protein
MINIIRKFINGEKLTEEEAKQVERYYGNKEKPKGFGDTIANLTKSVGIKPCGACKKRQEKLNKLFPYK